MQTVNAYEHENPRVDDVLKQDPDLYRQIIYGLLGIIAAMAGVMVLLL